MHGNSGEVVGVLCTRVRRNEDIVCMLCTSE